MKPEQIQQIIKDYHHEIISDIPVAIIDMDYKIFEINQPALSIFNLKLENVLGKSLIALSDQRWQSKLRSILDECVFYNQDKSVLSLRFTRPSKYRLLLFKYTPVISKDSGNIVSIKIVASIPSFKINAYVIYKIISNAFTQTELKAELPNNNVITPQELEPAVLFLLNNDLDYNEIASLLTMVYCKKYTKHLIAKLVSRKLYEKFDVTNLMALKQKYRKSKLSRVIPKFILQEFSYPIESL